MKVAQKEKEKVNPSILLATYWNFTIKKLVIWKLVLKKSGEFGPLFSMENPLFGSKSYFSGRNLTEVHPKQKKNAFMRNLYINLVKPSYG